MPDISTKSPALEGRLGSRATGVGIALNPYVQVALTYVRRPFSSPQGCAVSMICLFMGTGFLLMLLSGSRRDIAAAPVQMPLVQMPLMLAMAIVAALARHLKGQFADARARLTPGFRRVHATVAAAAAVLVAVVLPLVLIWLADVHSVGLVALAVFLFGAVLWAVALHSKLWSWLIILGFITTFTEQTRVLLWKLLSGEFEAQAVALLALGAALALVGGIRLVGLNEDMPAYHQPMRAGWAGEYQTSGQSPTGLGIFPPAFRERSLEKNMARWTNHARRASASWWSRVCRWQVGMPAGWPAFFMVFFAFVFFSITLFVSGQHWRNTTAVYPMIMFSFMSPCMFWGFFRRWRVPMLAHELLLPVDRRNFVKQVGMAAAVGQIQVWAGMSIGMALWVLLTARQTFSFTTLAVLLGIFALLQPWFFGVGAWFMRYRTLGLQVAGLVLALYVPMIPGAFCAETGPLSPWRYIALPLAAIMAIFGLLLTYDAYRRWLAADFD